MSGEILRILVQCRIVMQLVNQHIPLRQRAFPVYELAPFIPGKQQGRILHLPHTRNSHLTQQIHCRILPHRNRFIGG